MATFEPARFDLEALSDCSPEEALRRHQLTGLGIQREFDGWGITRREQIELEMRLAEVAPALSYHLAAYSGLAARLLGHGGSPEQKHRYLRALARGEKSAAIALTERASGSDLLSVETALHPDGDCWLLNGSKAYVSHGSSADFLLVLARVRGRGGRGSFSLCLVTKDDPGVSISEPAENSLLAEVRNCDLAFDAVRLSNDRLLPGDTFRNLEVGFEDARLSAAAVGAGICRFLLKEVLRECAGRIRSGKPLLEHQSVQSRIGELRLLEFNASAVVRGGAELRDSAEDELEAGAAAKVICAKAAEAAVSIATQLLGASSLTGARSLTRLAADVQGLSLYEGTSDLLTLLLGRMAVQRQASAGEAVPFPEGAGT